MANKPTSTIRERRLRERRLKGVLMVAPVEIGEGGVALLVGNGLLKEYETRNRNAVGAACLEALEHEFKEPRFSSGPGHLQVQAAPVGEQTRTFSRFHCFS